MTCLGALPKIDATRKMLTVADLVHYLTANKLSQYPSTLLPSHNRGCQNSILTFPTFLVATRHHMTQLWSIRHKQKSVCVRVCVCEHVIGATGELASLDPPPFFLP